MRKQFLSLTLVATVVTVMSGCLKDKGYDNREYQTQITEVKGVSFPEALGGPVRSSLVSQSTPMVIDGPDITLEQTRPASSDVHVTVTLNNALVTADPSLGLSTLPGGSFSINNLNITIPAGSSLSDEIKITLNNTGALDPTLTYGIGFTITTVDGGYTIASNKKNVIYAFTVRNKYDGIYRLKAYGNLGGNTAAPYLVSTDCAYELTLETLSADKVRMSNQPLWRSTGFSDGFCNVLFDFTFNSATNKVSAVQSRSECPPNAGIPVNFPATGSFPAQGVPGYDSRYDPATKTVYVAMGLNNNPAWVVVDTLIYCGPRP